MRILFVKPPFNRHNFVRHFMVCEPLEFEILGAALAGHHDVSVVDLRVDRRPLEWHLADIQPDFVGFTALTMDVGTVIDLARRVKAVMPEVVTCVGGEHASLSPADFHVEYVDHVVQYGAVTTFPELAAAVEAHKAGTTLKSPPRSWSNTSVSDDIQLAPLPRRDLCAKYLKKYIYGCASPVNLIQMTSGCAYKCTYCSIPSTAPRYQRRTVDAILADAAATSATDLLSIDANALQDVRGSMRLYSEFGRAKLRKRIMISCRTDTIVRHPELLPVLADAGVSVISFGIETFDDSKLERYNKRNTGQMSRDAVKEVHRHGMLVRGNFIVDQSFDRQDFHRLALATSQLDIDFPSFQILTPLPGTPFYREVASQILTKNYDYFDLSHSVLPTTRLHLDEFHECFGELFRTCYGPAKFLRLLGKVPLMSAFKGITAAVRSHIAFSYAGHDIGPRA